jgi:SAM-dependent methyltransferase
LKRVLFFLKSFSASTIIWLIANRIFSRKAALLKQYQPFFYKKKGLEIGGPSSFFTSKGYCPIYPIAETIDGVNFSSETLWETGLKEGAGNYPFEHQAGYQYIHEATVLESIPNNSYEFVLSCNSLEHIANPIKAVDEWKRVCKVNGVILIVVPNKQSNFDHKRAFTEFKHLLEDFTHQIEESDLTHMEEVLYLHDLKRDPYAISKDSFYKRTKENYLHRGMHHHVFSETLLKEIGDYLDLQILYMHKTPKDYYIILKKVS